MLSQKAINEFKEIWRTEYGQDLSEQEAQDKAIELLELMRAIYRPIPIAELVENKKANTHEIKRV